MNLCKITESVRNTSPLVHCITNPISINQCANALLALGARPIMAEHPREVKGITGSAASLLLNLGNITDARIKSVIISAKAAAKEKIPFVLDLVGVSCSSLRRKLAGRILRCSHPAVIKGNFSEILAMYDFSYFSSGVDADRRLDVSDIAKISAQLANKYRCTVLASGKADIVTDGKCTVLIKNGCVQLSQITGTGCMLGAICAAFLPFSAPFEAAVTSCAVLGICGENSRTENGAGSFLSNLLDNLSSMNGMEFEKHIRMEEITP